jgi:hypothetical protein
MKAVQVPIRIDYTTVPRRYRSLLRKLERGLWRRDELRWIQRHHANLPLIVLAVIRQKLRQTSATHGMSASNSSTGEG